MGGGNWLFHHLRVCSNINTCCLLVVNLVQSGHYYCSTSYLPASKFIVDIIYQNKTSISSECFISLNNYQISDKNMLNWCLCSSLTLYIYQLLWTIIHPNLHTILILQHFMYKKVILNLHKSNHDMYIKYLLLNINSSAPIHVLFIYCEFSILLL